MALLAGKATPLPLFAGEEGPKPKAWEVRVFSDSEVQTLTSHRFAAGPSSPVRTGRDKNYRVAFSRSGARTFPKKLSEYQRGARGASAISRAIS